ncbi:MAG TPA: hypothetical protein VJ810_31225 [Blastocatellia bacterium]|nr:hypothetical protein [Blastocatellia bacterium]
MKDERANEEALERYLLGQLSEEEQQQIEQRFFDDEQFYQRLLEVEDELRCAYAQGALPRAQQAQFERRFLIFADERKRVELARDMLAELPRVSVEEPFSPASRRSGPKTARSWLRWSFGWQSPAWGFALAAALVIIAGSVWLLFETARLRYQLSQLRSERAADEQRLERRSAEERALAQQLSQQLEKERAMRAQLERELGLRDAQPTAPSSRPTVIALLLTPGLVRGGGETKRLTLPPDVRQAQFRLELTGAAHSRYNAVLLNSDGREVWRRAGLQARLDGVRRVIILNIPARFLAEDDYELKLAGLDEDGQPARAASYYFTILKK